jgi:hypothetical protein
MLQEIRTRGAVVTALILALAALPACGDDCTAEPATEFACDDPNDCVAIFLTWNLDNESSQPDTSGPDMDLRLIQTPSSCVYSGDVMSSDAPIPQEFYICNQPANGDFEFAWSTLFIFDVETRIDINKNGATSCMLSGKRGATTIQLP